MTPTADEEMARIVEMLRMKPGLAEQLTGQDAAVVRAALDGQDIHVIASEQGIPESAAWAMLSNAAQLAAGTPPVQETETGGLGSDTDPGVTGGYGETAFGSLGNEPPSPTPEEPSPPTQRTGQDLAEEDQGGEDH